MYILYCTICDTKVQTAFSATASRKLSSIYLRECASVMYDAKTISSKNINQNIVKYSRYIFSDYKAFRVKSPPIIDINNHYLQFLSQKVLFIHPMSGLTMRMSSLSAVAIATRSLLRA